MLETGTSRTDAWDDNILSMLLASDSSGAVWLLEPTTLAHTSHDDYR